MKSVRAALVAIVVAGLCGVVLVSCGGPQDAGSARPVLNRGISSDPESLDPHKIRSVQAGEVLRDIGEGLAGYTPTGELIPAAAESWTMSDDGLTYTFAIRADARWSNGDAVTAEHFAFSLRRLVDPATAAFNAHLIADVVNARAISSGEKPPTELGVQAVNDQMLVIRLAQPTPYFLSLLTHAAP
ncbi:MAG: ABC transporter substrate-binding protein, partial [Gammaproteobacteria bacterium]|nr:ABC transporter substrate-binding protein [Gammaproteobacteria bacterium]